MASIGALLRAAREKTGLSLDDVAKKAGVPTAHLSMIENGRRKSPEFVTLAKIAPVLGLRLDDIAAAFGLNGFESRPPTDAQTGVLHAVRGLEQVERLTLKAAEAAAEARARLTSQSAPSRTSRKKRSP